MASGIAGSRDRQQDVHVIVFPYPAHGHINPMLQLAREIVSLGYTVTFVCTQHRCENVQREDQRRLLWPRAGDGGGGGLFSSMRLEGLADGLPADFDRGTPSTQLSQAIDNLGGAFEELLHRLLLQHSSTERTCLISDSFLPWTQHIAAKHGIPRVFFWTQSAAAFAIFANLDCLPLDPFKDDIDTSREVIDCIPGLPHPLPVTHLPVRAFKTPDGQDRRFLVYEVIRRQFGQLSSATPIIANSFDELEEQPAPRQFAGLRLLGPLLPLAYLESAAAAAGGAADDDDDDVDNEGLQCLRWLDTQAASSVLYISLGSVVKLSTRHVAELGEALAASRQPFLWVLREQGGEGDDTSAGWCGEKALEMGKVVGWAPQPLVLAHPAVGGFLTHGGWNSTLEGLSMGVPMVVWPQFLDQFSNCWLVVRVWKIGVELYYCAEGGPDEQGAREERFPANRSGMERAVRLLMQEEPGRLLRGRAAALRDAARAAVSTRGLRAHVQLFIDGLFK